jgi:hypothetical protein
VFAPRHRTGLAQAAAHLATLPERLEPRRLIDSLLDALLGDTKAEDDIAILVIANTERARS